MFGIVGFETAFPLLYSKFVKTGTWTLQQLIDWLTIKPSKTFNLPYGTVALGQTADLVLLDLEKQQAIDADGFLSKGRNTPFDGWNCKGWPVMTIFGGEIVWQEETN